MCRSTRHGESLRRGGTEFAGAIATTRRTVGGSVPDAPSPERTGILPFCKPITAYPDTLVVPHTFPLNHLYPVHLVRCPAELKILQIVRRAIEDAGPYSNCSPLTHWYSPHIPLNHLYPVHLVRCPAEPKYCKSFDEPSRTHPSMGEAPTATAGQLPRCTPVRKKANTPPRPLAIPAGSMYNTSIDYNALSEVQHAYTDIRKLSG